MKTPDKQWSVEKDKDRNKAERDEMAKDRAKQQQGEEQGADQQGGFSSGKEKPQDGMGRKPGVDRDRDYDPDGDRTGR